MSRKPERDYYSSFKYVKVNDVILLEKGQTVYCQDFPAYFTKDASAYSTMLIDGLVQVGLPVTRPVRSNDLRVKIADAIDALFGFYKIPLNTSVMHRFIANQVKDLADDTFLLPEGLYQIYNMVEERMGRKVLCKTFRPREDRPELRLFFFLESHSPANHEVVKIVKDVDKTIL